jgi:hypothetical protein
MQQLSIQVEVRAVAGTKEFVFVLFDRATEMSTGQTQGREAALGMNQHGRDIRQ